MLSFPKGLIPAPGLAQRVGWLLKDNRGVLVALARPRPADRLLRARVASRRARSTQGRRDRALRAAGRTDAGEPAFPDAHELRHAVFLGGSARARGRRLPAHRARQGILQGRVATRAHGTAPPEGSSHGQRTLLARLFKDGEPTLVLKNTQCFDPLCRAAARIRKQPTISCSRATTSRTTARSAKASCSPLSLCCLRSG